MSEDTPRNDAGQFTSSTSEGLYGREALEAEAGYVSTKRESEPEFDLADGADIINAIRAEDEAPIMEIRYQDGSGEALNADINDGPVKAVTIEEAARDLSAFRDTQANSRADSISKDFAAEIDKFRSDAINEGLDPKSTGIDKVSPTAEVPEETVANDKSGTEPAEPGQLDPVLAKQIREHPEVRELIASEIAETHRTRESYNAALNTVLTVQMVALADSVPELQQLPPQQREAALLQLAQTNPQRFEAVMGMLSRAHQVQEAQRQQHAQIQQHQSQVQQQQFVQHVQAEDARLVQMVGQEQADAATAATLKYLADAGVPREQMFSVFAANPALRTAEARQLIADAQKFRALQNAPKPRPTRDIPPMQKPGTANRVSRSEVETSDLERRFASATGNKQLELAAALSQARRSARKG